MVITENYTTKKSAQNAIESTKKNAPGAEVVDETLAAAAAKPAKAAPARKATAKAK
jgi:hypothetical protein